MTICLAIYTKI